MKVQNVKLANGQKYTFLPESTVREAFAWADACNVNRMDDEPETVPGEHYGLRSVVAIHQGVSGMKSCPLSGWPGRGGVFLHADYPLAGHFSHWERPVKPAQTPVKEPAAGQTGLVVKATVIPGPSRQWRVSVVVPMGQADEIFRRAPGWHRDGPENEFGQTIQTGWKTALSNLGAEALDLSMNGEFPLALELHDNGNPKRFHGYWRD